LTGCRGNNGAACGTRRACDLAHAAWRISSATARQLDRKLSVSVPLFNVRVGFGAQLAEVETTAVFSNDDLESLQVRHVSVIVHEVPKPGHNIALLIVPPAI